MNELQLLKNKIDEIAAFLNNYNTLINCHMVEFITDNFFQRLIPADFICELSNLSDRQLCQLPNARPGFLNESENPNLTSFLRQIQHLSLVNLISDQILDNFLQNAEDETGEKISVHHFMGVKKSHEVERMGRFINKLAEEEEISMVVDIGSGKGYLSSLLAMCFNLEMPNISLHWRALFQQILVDKLGANGATYDFKVGPIAKRCENFDQYCIKCIEKLKLSFELTDKEINQYERNFEDFKRKMNIFFQFRCFFAPIIESIVLLDKLCYLVEKMPVVRKAKIVQIFNPEKSPRCYAIVAHK
uniref:Methyltransferase domain-containing protein n=1 Tax=Romanomermis culicivorax TaxID=13658 RepID=A0A915KDH2_ROMCU